MKLSIINRFFTTTLTVILLSSFFQVQAQTTKSAKKNSPVKSKTEREITENIIREYILKNPSIIREALIALEAQDEKDKQQAAADNLVKYNSDIYTDADSPVAGNEKGDVTVVVFFDYFCGYCRKTLPELKSLTAKDSAVRIIYKELPIMGAESVVAAQAALAAEKQGKYSEFHYALLESDNASDTTIKGLCKKLGLNYEMLKKDMNDIKLNQSIERNQNLAAAIGVGGTPAYLVGKRFIPGAIDAVALAQIVADERAKSGKASKSKVVVTGTFAQ
jgi:protein-disulfide isomerase